MKISVITIAYNSADTIGDTLRSIAAQGYPEVEHVVVDGGSTDATLDLVKQLGSRVGKLVSEKDRGIYDAMNKGIALASGDVIGTLNSDDMYADADVLAEVAKVFADPTVDACYADLVYVDRDSASRVSRYWQSSPFRPGLFARGWCPPHPTFFVRREVYERLGVFDLRYTLAADVILMMKFLEIARIKTVHVPKVWIKMRQGGVTNNSLRNILKQNREILRAAREMGLPIGLAQFVVAKIFDRARQVLKSRC
ncbi:MAG TPA: glycosyltransferase family 2 protein [Rhodocyclaceae bacterium]